jgi:hypothetical protein
MLFRDNGARCILSIYQLPATIRHNLLSADGLCQANISNRAPAGRARPILQYIAKIPPSACLAASLCTIARAKGTIHHPVHPPLFDCQE